MTVANSFRGIQGIREIKSRISRLAQWNKKFRPDIRTLTLARKDFDLIARWPKAAQVEGFDVTHNGVFFDGFQLNYSSGEGRYETRAAVTQEDFA